MDDGAVVVGKIVGAARFDREAFLWMLWNDRAGGDAALIVIATELAFSLALAGLDIIAFLFFLVSGLIFWLVYSGFAWAAAKYLFDGDGRFQGVFRIVGFAYPARLVILPLLFILNFWLAMLVGSIWFLAIVAYGIKEAMELPLQQAALSAGAGLLGFLIFSAIFGRF